MWPRSAVGDGKPKRIVVRDQWGYPSSLTARHCEVLVLVARGLRNAQIAQTLYITEGTAELHLSQIYQRLGVSNRIEAVGLALRRGIVSVADIGNPS